MKKLTDYSRQNRLNIPQINCASVVGCGGTGSWTSIFLAMSGTRKLKLFDSDGIEGHNLNRLPFPHSAIGELKTQALKDLVNSLRNECSILCFDNIEPINYSLLEGVVYDCTDQRAIQDALQDYCEEKKLTYRRVGYDGNHITTLSMGRPQNIGEPQDGYTVIPSWVIPAVLVSALAVFSTHQAMNMHSFVGAIQSIYNTEETS